MIADWRQYAVIAIMILAVADLGLTYYYVFQYKQWQPEKPFKMIELNPLLRYLWNTFGLHLGMFIGIVIILSLNYIVGKNAYWLIVLLLLGFLIFALYNHMNNISLLHQLIEKYPSGYLPVETFGEVIGSNPKP